MMDHFGLDTMVDILKAVAEPSRLRILLLLNRGDLTVSDLTTILGQSQPRVSRHLRLLAEVQLIERYQEGAWAYFALSSHAARQQLIKNILSRVADDDLLINHDMERLDQVKQQRQVRANQYFSQNASQWDELRLLHVADDAVEKAMLAMIGTMPFQAMLDIGTGTAKLLQLFAHLYTRGVGIDINRDMLAVARVNLDMTDISHAQVRLGDICAIPAPRESFDLVSIHQVLHFIDDPQMAISEAARVMRPNARLVIVDFAAHELEFLREEHAHLRLGFSDAQIAQWAQKAGLVLEKTETFTPNKKGNPKGLTIKLWLVRDPRLLIAQHATDTEIA